MDLGMFGPKVKILVSIGASGQVSYNVSLAADVIMTKKSEANFLVDKPHTIRSKANSDFAPRNGSLADYPAVTPLLLRTSFCFPLL